MRPILTLSTVVIALLVPAAAQAGTLKVASGVLSYTDTSTTNANAVAIAPSPDGTRITVTETGKTSRNRALTVTSDGSCTVSGSTGSCAAAGITSITVDAGGANDRVTNTTAVPSRLVGGAGNDAIAGGGGDDVFVEEPGADVYSGGPGRDTIDYSKASGSVNVSLDAAPNDGIAGELDNVGTDIEVLIGSPAADILNGGAADESLAGGAGDDTLVGGPGNDTLDGGTGNDALTGGDGIDTATYEGASAGVRVTLDGQPGDGIAGEADNVDTENVIGSPGDDVLIGNAAVNVLTGGAGNDRILGGEGADTLDAGAGDDILQSLDGNKDTVLCGDGEDGVVSDKPDVRTDCDYIKYRTVAASSTALHVSNGSVRAPVRCSPATADGCHGRLALKSGRTVLGSLRYSLKSGRRWVARIKLSKKGRAYVAKRRVTKAVLVVREVDTTGDAIRTTQTIRIGS